MHTNEWRKFRRFLIECLVALEKDDSEREERQRKKRFMYYLSGPP